MTLYHDITNNQTAVTSGKPAMINAAFGTFLVLLGTPIYFFYKTKTRRAGQSEP